MKKTTWNWIAFGAVLTVETICVILGIANLSSLVGGFGLAVLLIAAIERW